MLILVVGITRLESGGSGGTTGGILMIASIVALFMGLILLITASPFKIAGHHKGWFRMKGVSPDLLAELPERDWKTL